MLEFGVHALQRLAQYGISREDVEFALDHPIWQSPGKEGAIVLAGPTKSGIPIGVVFNDSVILNKRFIVTVYWFARAQKW